MRRREHHQSALLQTDCKKEGYHCDWAGPLISANLKRLQQCRIPRFLKKQRPSPKAEPAWRNFSVNLNFHKPVIPTSVKRARASEDPLPPRFWREWADKRASRTEGPCACFFKFTVSMQRLAALALRLFPSRSSKNDSALANEQKIHSKAYRHQLCVEQQCSAP